MKNNFLLRVLLCLLVFGPYNQINCQVRPVEELGNENIAPPPPRPRRPSSTYSSSPSKRDIKRFKLKTDVSSFEENGVYGLKKGDSIIQSPKYTRFILNSDSFIAESPLSYDLWSSSGELIKEITTKYDDFVKAQEAYHIYNNGLKGVLNLQGEVTIPPIYKELHFIEELVIVKTVDDAYKLYTNGEESESFTNITTYKNGFSAKQNGKYGFFGVDGNKTGFQYDSIFIKLAYGSNKNKKQSNPHKIIKTYSTGPFVVQKNDYVGLLNSNSELLIPIKYKNISNQRGIIILENDTSKKAIYSLKNGKQTDFLYEQIYALGGNHIRVTENNKKGILNRNLEMILPINYDNIEWHSKGGFVITNDKKEGWADIEGTIIIEPKYDELDDFHFGIKEEFKNYFKVKNDGKYGVINNVGEAILPIEYRYIRSEDKYIGVVDFDKKIGIYSLDGDIILPTEYDYVDHSVSERTNIKYLKKDNKIGLSDENFNIVLPVSQREINYLHNTHLLFNPLTPNNNLYLFAKADNGKVGVFEEHKQQLIIPQEYDAILQKFDTRTKTYFLATKKNKYGLIDDKNEVIIPFKYDDLDIDFLTELPNSSTKDYKVIFNKKGKYGLMNFDGEVTMEAKYEHLVRISDIEEIYKAKKDGFYSIIRSNGEIIHSGPFDDIDLFWKNEVLAFKNDTATVINKDGSVQFSKPMKMHDGFRTFEELKFALVDALNGEDEELIEFTKKIAPSEHIQHFVLKHPDGSSLYYDSNYYDRQVNRYAKRLFEFKYWWLSDYNKHILTKVNDYTLYEGEYIIVKRTTDWAYGDTKDLEKILRNCFRVNGYWVSGYFLSDYY